MPVPLTYQSVDIKPLSGLMDNRSSPDSLPAGSWRMRQNITVQDQGRACRRPGWGRFRWDKETYNNEDLHDQLLSLQTYYEEADPPHVPPTDITTYPPGNDNSGTPLCGQKKIREIRRQPITLLYSALSTAGDRKLIAGTQNRIYGLSEAQGNWQILADAYGGDPLYAGERRFKCAQVDNVVVFTNNFDPPVYYILDQPPFGCGMQCLAPVDSLAGIGLTKASAIGAWKGSIFLGDVEMDGERAQYRIVWSGFKDPTNFTPSNASVASHQDLPYGGRILAIKPLSDVLLIYTTKSIWECRFTGDDQVFSFTEHYSEPENGEGCLAYANTLASNGDVHLFAGRDGIYAFNLFMPRPERLEWIHRATKDLFDDINEQACEAHVGWFHPATKEYWLSWARKGENLPSRSLVINTQYQTSDDVDAGFTAFCDHAPDDTGTLSDFLLSQNICTPAELVANPDVATIGVKQGGYCIKQDQTPEIVIAMKITIVDKQFCMTWPSQVGLSYNVQTKATINEAEWKTIANITATETETTWCTPMTKPFGFYQVVQGPVTDSAAGDRNTPIWTNQGKNIDGRIIEDYDKAEADANSLCTWLHGLRFEDLCGECEKASLLVMASSLDYSLKQYGGIYYRDVYPADSDFGPCAEPTRVGYDSILRTGALDFGYPREDKTIRSLEVEYDADPQFIPSPLEVRIGYSAQAVDSNLDSPGRCALVWRPLSLKSLECLSDRSGPEHIQVDTRPYRTLSWQFWFTGRYLYMEFKISGKNGAVCFSRATMEVRQMARTISSG